MAHPACTQTVYAVENGDANWSSAAAVATALGRRLLVHAPRSRKMTVQAIADQTALSPNTIQKVMLVAARSDALDVDVHLASLEAYLDHVQGYVMVRK